MHSSKDQQNTNMSRKMKEKSKKYNKEIDRESDASLSASDSDYEENVSSSESEEEVAKKKRKREEAIKKKKKTSQVIPKENTKKKMAEKKTPSAKKVQDLDFDEADVTIDMSVENLEKKKIKLTSNLMIERRMIDIKEPGKKQYSFPAIVFLRKMKDEKAFEFNLPLSVGPKLVDALEIFLKK